ncbi:hypothetical protein INR49_011075 [Caranx melampygus]|nr:hypothetical protein INR49_011075 [Caranx melampygus]
MKRESGREKGSETETKDQSGMRHEEKRAQRDAVRRIRTIMGSSKETSVASLRGWVDALKSSSTTLIPVVLVVVYSRAFLPFLTDRPLLCAFPPPRLLVMATWTNRVVLVSRDAVDLHIYVRLHHVTLSSRTTRLGQILPTDDLYMKKLGRHPW